MYSENLVKVLTIRVVWISFQIKIGQMALKVTLLVSANSYLARVSFLNVSIYWVILTLRTTRMAAPL